MVGTFKLRRAAFAFLLLSDRTLSFSPSPFQSTFKTNYSVSLDMSGSSSSSAAAAASSSSSSLSVSQQMDMYKSLISTAISIGAPAYNTGDIPECARIYKETSLQIAPMLPQNLQTGLEATIQQTFKDADEEAWAFRKQFDSIIDYQMPFVPSNEMTNATVTILEPFTDSNMIPSHPCVVNDNVMGGVSQGKWLPASKTFRGKTSLANNGGFSSLRWRFDRIQNWTYAKGIYLKVRHSDPSAHTFRVILKDTTCEQVRLSNFKNVFCNPHLDQKAGDANPIFIPFDSFDQMEQMGRRLSPGQVFNRAEVTELGLMAIKPTVIGEFELHIQEWGLYS